VSIAPANILQHLRALDGITPPLWLTGGVAVDFLVGRWTRPHKDLDLIAFSPTRAALQTELGARGFSLAQEGAWNTRWAFAGADADLEIVFVEPAEPWTGVLVIPQNDPTSGRAGRYPLLPESLDPLRFAVLDGVRFRVCSAESEWWSRIISGNLVPGRSMEPKIRHDLDLLEQLVPESRRNELSAQAGRMLAAPAATIGRIVR
jgi:hypothetical protein